MRVRENDSWQVDYSVDGILTDAAEGLETQLKHNIERLEALRNEVAGLEQSIELDRVQLAELRREIANRN